MILGPLSSTLVHAQLRADVGGGAARLAGEVDGGPTGTDSTWMKYSELKRGDC